MTLTLALTILGIWVAVSIPSSLLIASAIAVGKDPEPIAGETATKKAA